MTTESATSKMSDFYLVLDQHYESVRIYNFCNITRFTNDGRREKVSHTELREMLNSHFV